MATKQDLDWSFGYVGTSHFFNTLTVICCNFASSCVLLKFKINFSLLAVFSLTMYFLFFFTAIPILLPPYIPLCMLVSNTSATAAVTLS